MDRIVTGSAPHGKGDSEVGERGAERIAADQVVVGDEDQRLAEEDQGPARRDRHFEDGH